MIDFSGKRIVVTGAAGGVGKALTRVFSRAGGHVIALDIDGKALAGIGAGEIHTVDLTDLGATRETINAILADGAPDVVLSNLGWTRAETFDELDDQSMAFELDINLGASMRLSRLLLPALVEKAKTDPVAYIFISSVNAHAHFGNPAYAAAKGGLEAWSRGIATEYGAHGIRSNVIAPASIRTMAWDHRFEKDPDVGKAVSRLYPMGRMVEPEEVAHAAAFLASPLASAITGITLPVDCGLMASNLGFLDAIAPDRMNDG
ncbi:SDR family oxidoreductase [Pelagibacterium montanilacus]|uniref:SDR family oxidoreductase n=1 Tax=Pelagibacterium montanilacus TaxID=2185280 RepID=UPI000F8DE29D|nr:SDR family oxidoreductase [Pelagibacterium montanilacus]